MKSAPPPPKRQRAVQARAKKTQEKIIERALELFATNGFDGVSIREIEIKAKVKRGLVAYHFGSKNDLWCRVMDALFARIPPPPEDDPNLNKAQKLRIQIKHFVRFSADNPELSRVILQEGKVQTWRSTYLLDNFVRPRVTLIQHLFGSFDAHSHYIVIGAATLVFDVSAECQALFGINPYDDAFVDAHADRVTDLILGINAAFAKQLEIETNE